MTTTTTPFSAVLAARTRTDTSVGFHVTEDWLQGRTSFGGLVSAIAVQAMRDVGGGAWPDDVSLRALQVSFVGPVGLGAVEVQVKLLREGRNVRQLQATVMQDDQVAAVALGVFSADRASSLPPRLPTSPPAAKAAETLESLPYIAGLMPAFLQQFERRWADGALPYSGGTGWTSSIHMRSLDPAPVSAELLTVLMADLSPTPAVGHLAKPAPTSSVSWALELRPVAAGPGWWRADNEALAVGGGYVNQSAKLWAPDGTLAAFGYQVVTVFA